MVNTRNEKEKDHLTDDPMLIIKQLRRSAPAKAKALLKKLKKKKAIKNKRESAKDVDIFKQTEASQNESTEEVEYIKENIDERLAQHFQDVYERFKENSTTIDDTNEELERNETSTTIMDDSSRSSFDTDSDYRNESDDMGHKEEGKKSQRISKRLIKLKNRPSIMKLKEFAEKPELVEVWDTSANDPFFYVWLKCVKNSVSIPQHWCVKRKYMHGKRGFERMPYKLPHYIEDTKISEIRQSIREKEEQKSTKQKMRDRVRPKLHTMDIDYQTLHDAFFKYATKPKLVKFGELYYEGKELQLQTKKFRPGVISKKLRKALNIGINDPLPWINNMQKYGIPPSFPYLQIKGVNYFPSEEMKMNSYSADGKTHYKYNTEDSDGSLVYGTFVSTNVLGKYPENFLWGELERKEEEEEDSDEEQQEEKEREKEEIQEELKEKEKKDKDEEEMKYENAYKKSTSTQENANKMANMGGTYSVLTNSKMSGTYTPFMDSGLMSVDINSFIPGYETPSYINPGNWNVHNVKPYTVLQAEEMPISSKALFASNVKYKINANTLKNNNNNYINKSSNISEGFQTPFTPGGLKTPFTPMEIGCSEKEKSVISQDSSYNTNPENVRKELNKFEKIANRANMLSAQVDYSKKVKKEDKKKKKKKDFKF